MQDRANMRHSKGPELGKRSHPYVNPWCEKELQTVMVRDGTIFKTS